MSTTINDGSAVSIPMRAISLIHFDRRRFESVYDFHSAVRESLQRRVHHSVTQTEHVQSCELYKQRSSSSKTVNDLFNRYLVRGNLEIDMIAVMRQTSCDVSIDTLMLHLVDGEEAISRMLTRGSDVDVDSLDVHRLVTGQEQKLRRERESSFLEFSYSSDRYLRASHC